MKGRKPKPSVTVQRAFAQTRLSDDWLAQAYEHVLRGVQLTPPSANCRPPRPVRPRKRVPRVATTVGRTS